MSRRIRKATDVFAIAGAMMPRGFSMHVILVTFWISAGFQVVETSPSAVCCGGCFACVQNDFAIFTGGKLESEWYRQRGLLLISPSLLYSY